MSTITLVCCVSRRRSFIQLIGDLSELREKKYGDESRGVSRPSTGPHNVDAVAGNNLYFPTVKYADSRCMP